LNLIDFLRKSTNEQRHMRSVRKGLLAGGLLAVFSFFQPAFGQLTGSDDFNGATENTSNWGGDIDSGVGNFSQTNGTLLYTTAGTPTSNDQAIRPWQANYGSYTQNWVVQLDVNLPTQSLSSGQIVSIGVAVLDASNTNDDIYAAMQQDIPHSTLFFSGQDINGVSQTPVELGNQTAGLAAVQISYDAATQEITTAYDANGPVGGYNWTTLATDDISGWDMTSSDQFLIAISASSQGDLSVPGSSEVYADNFQAQTIPEPSAWSILAGLGAGLLAWRRKRKTRIPRVD
jgi:hypothetical protein